MISSKYKIFGGFGLGLILIAIVGWIDFEFIFNVLPNIHHFNPIENSDHRDVFILISSFNVMALLLFTTQCKHIRINQEGIVFTNPLLPLLKRKYFWNDFDYYVSTDEYNRSSTHKAVWLIKNGKAKIRISSFYYSNFDLLMQNLNIKYMGQRKTNVFQQAGAFFGMKVFDLDE